MNMSNSDFNDVSSDDGDFDPDNEYGDIWPKNRENAPTAEDEVVASKDSTLSSNILTKLTTTCIQEILQILEERKDVSFKNMLEINKEMQSRLQMIRQQIEILYRKVKKRYADNEQRLQENLKVKKHCRASGVFGKLNRGERFYLKGNTYFKDRNDRFCPNNEDYFSRSNNGEVFPMDFELVSRHIWSISDKMSIVKGIKEQIHCEKSPGWLKKNGAMKLAKMLEEVGDDFRIDWAQISTYYLRHRHAPSSCKAMWEVYLHPALKHSVFSNEENERLLTAAQNYDLQNWIAIAGEVGKRSDYQCFLQYHTSAYFRNRANRWDKKDDVRLLEVIEKSRCNGVINWSEVAFYFPQKPKNCLQQRYQYAINPSISHEQFTGDEDLLLLAAVQEYGTSFSKFPTSLFPNRSSTQLRSRYWNTLQDRHKKSMWTLEDDKLLMAFVEEHGKSSWKQCSEIFENRHNRISCRQRYTVIQRHLQKDANATLEQMPRREHRMNKSTVTPKNWQGLVEMLRKNPNASLKVPPPRRKRKRTAAKASIRKEKASQKVTEAPPKKVRRKSAKKLKTSEDATSKPLLENSEIIVRETRNSLENPEEVANFIYHKHKRANVDRSSRNTPLIIMEDVEKEIYVARNVEKVEKTNEEIIEEEGVAKEKRTQKLVPPNFIYLDGLRRFGLQFHNLFKFSYNFSFCRKNRNNPSSPLYMRDARIVKPCLGIQMPLQPPPMQPYYNLHINGLYMPMERSRELGLFIRDGIRQGTTLEPNGSLIQPNFSTFVTFRAMCALMGDFEKNQINKKFEELQKYDEESTIAKETISNTQISSEALSYSPVIRRFRQRFRALFYQTAVLSRLPPDTFDNKQIKEPEEYQFDSLQVPDANEQYHCDDLPSSSVCASATIENAVEVKSEFPNENESLVSLLNCKEEPVFGEEFY